ncbi:TPA: TraR/DksA C4-type zinc finger protein, partial [Klebsiella pneumoniae]
LFHCRVCGKPIPEKRRQALPGVTTCTECQEKLERSSR